MIQRDMMSDHGTSPEELEDDIGKSNWLEDKEKSGTPVTKQEIDQLWQEAVQDLMEAEKHAVANNNYVLSRVLSKLHIHLWELRDAAVYALKQTKS